MTQRGSLDQLPSGRWRARYRAPGRGRVSATFRRKGDASLWLRTELARLNRGNWVDPNAGLVAFGEFVERWTPTRRHLRPSTQDQQQSLMRNHVLPFFGALPLKYVDQLHWDGFLSGLSDKGLAPATVRQCHLVARSVFQLALDRGFISSNPAKGASLPTAEPPEPQPLTRAQVASIWEGTAPRLRPLVTLGSYAGLRWGEAAGLRIFRVDFMAAAVNVDANLTRAGVLGPPKSNAARRRVAVPRFVVEEIAAILETSGHANALVFSNAQGSVLDYSNWRRRHWLPAVHAAGLDGVVFHQLRDTQASWLAEAGQHPKVIQERLGHADISTTMSIYAALMPGMDDAAATALEALGSPVGHIKDGRSIAEIA